MCTYFLNVKFVKFSEIVILQRIFFIFVILSRLLSIIWLENMILTVTTLTGQMFPMDVAEDLELENFKAICEAESGFPAEEIVILVNFLY